VRPIAPAPDLKVPHMGWNDVTPARDHPVVAVGEAYFLHGYAFQVADDDDVLAMTNHGGPRVAAIARDNMMGVQFHPEKSQRYGIETLQRFLKWRP
jgi:imidazole glycerol-phosphate synthase subunit HisH